MGTAVYSLWDGGRTARAAGSGFSWMFFVLTLGIVWLWVWIGWHAIKAMGRSERSDRDRDLPPISPGAWGEPDLAPPSTSPEALVEVAELEALWRQSGRRRRAASD